MADKTIKTNSGEEIALAELKYQDENAASVMMQ